MKSIFPLILLLALAMTAHGQSDKADDTWESIRFLEGVWVGNGDGMSGQSEVRQEYAFVLKGKFLQMKTRAVFPPQEKNPEGEVHEDIAMLSYDKARKTFVLRAFYVEGFVNTYLMNTIQDEGVSLVFETESIENAPPGTKAKLILRQISENELEEKFYVSFPGKNFDCFVTNILMRE